jgi:hypothetical protein
MHRTELQRGHVIRYGHHAIVILKNDGDVIIARDDEGHEGLVDLPEEVLLSGYAGEGIYAHLALDDRD